MLINKKHLLLLFLCIYSALSIAEQSESEINKQIKASGGIENYLKESATIISAGLPTTSSKNKELISVVADKKIITYNFKYTVPIKLDFFLSHKDEMHNRWLNSICSGHMSKILFKHGVTIRHSSSTNVGVIFFMFEANKSTCA